MVEGDFVTREMFEDIYAKEENPMLKVLYKLLWELKLRIGEVTGDSKLLFCSRCDKPIRTWKLSRMKSSHRTPHCPCEKPQKTWRSNLPGIKRQDIDAEKPQAYGLPKGIHTLRIWGKKRHFDVLPLSDELFSDITNYLKGKRIANNERIFQVSRGWVYRKLRTFGMTPGGKKPIHPHAIRRGAGQHDHMVEHIPIEEIQGIYRHANLGQTVQYLDLGSRQAIAAYARRKYGKGG